MATLKASDPLDCRDPLLAWKGHNVVLDGHTGAVRSGQKARLHCLSRLCVCRGLQREDEGDG